MKKWLCKYLYHALLANARLRGTIALAATTSGVVASNLPCVPEESLDYMAPLFPAPADVTKTKGSDDEFGPPLTTAEHYQRDELIMAHVYGLEMLRKRIGCRASTVEQLSDVADRYPLNAHAKIVLGIEPVFLEPVDDDVPIDEDNLHTIYDVDIVFDTEDVDPQQAVEEAKGGDTIDD